MRNLSNENEFDLHENELVGRTHFHMNGIALRLVLTRRQKGTQKLPITPCTLSSNQKKNNDSPAHDSPAHIFSRFAPATCIHFEF